MYVVPKGVLLDLMQQITTASQQLRDEHGERKLTTTIDEKTLRGAALAALLAVTGEVVWPGDRELRIKAQPETYGIIHLER
jgi:hypothetical protein